MLFLMSIFLSTAASAQVRVSIIPYSEIELADPVCLLYQLAEKKPLSLYHAGFGGLVDYQFNKMLSVGAGIEADGIEYGFCSLMNTADYMAWTLPIYGNFRISIDKWKTVPFCEVQLGYAFALNTVTTPSWQGDLRAKGLFTGIGLGMDLNRHEITVGCKWVPVSGNLTNSQTGEAAFRQERAANIYLRYGYRIGLID